MAMMMHGHGFLLGQKIGMHARIIATAAIYQKVDRRGGGEEVGGEVGERVKGGNEREGREEGRGGRELGGRREGGGRCGREEERWREGGGRREKGGREGEAAGERRKRQERGERGVGREVGERGGCGEEEEEKEERGEGLVASGWLLAQLQFICVLCHSSGADSESGVHQPDLHWSCSQPCIQ